MIKLSVSIFEQSIRYRIYTVRRQPSRLPETRYPVFGIYFKTAITMVQRYIRVGRGVGLKIPESSYGSGWDWETLFTLHVLVWIRLDWIELIGRTLKLCRLEFYPVDTSLVAPFYIHKVYVYKQGEVKTLYRNKPRSSKAHHTLADFLSGECRFFIRAKSVWL